MEDPHWSNAAGQGVQADIPRQGEASVQGSTNGVHAKDWHLKLFHAPSKTARNNSIINTLRP